MSDNRDLLYDVEIKCPVCRKKFTTKKIRHSRLRLKERQADFLNIYEEENPIKYNIFVCPHCGFAAYEESYENGIKDYFAKNIKGAISSKWRVRDFGKKRSLDQAIVTYKLALLNGKYMDMSKLDSANLCLNIAWLYRLKGNEKEEAKFIRFSRDRFRETYSSERLDGSKMTEARLTYLVGELSRQLGERKEALTWFNLCLNNPEAKEETGLLDLTRDQLREARQLEE